MSLEQAARKFHREMEGLGLGVTIQLPGEEPVVIVEPPKETSMNAVTAPVRIPQQLTFDIGGDLARPTGASFQISGKGDIRNQLLMGDDLTLRVIAADGEIVAEFEGSVTNVAFKHHAETETAPEYIERAHTIKLGDRIE